VRVGTDVNVGPVIDTQLIVNNSELVLNAAAAWDASNVRTCKYPLELAVACEYAVILSLRGESALACSEVVVRSSVAGNGGGGLYALISSTHSNNENTSVTLTGVNASANSAVGSGGGAYIGVGSSFDILGATLLLENVNVDDNVGGE
jgi:hypothetical protein